MADMCAYCRLDTAGNHETGCRLHPDNQKDKTDQRVDAPFVGWTCPACGGGLLPFTTRCPCVPLPAPQISITVEGFVGDEKKLAEKIPHTIRQADPVGHGFEVIGEEMPEFPGMKDRPRSRTLPESRGGKL